VSGICSAIDDCAKENLDHSQVGTKDVDYFLGVDELYKINRTRDNKLSMRALKFYQTGSLDNLRLEEVPMPRPGPGDVLVQVKAAAINPSDVKNVQGKMHETSVPRIPGRDFAGLVVQGPDELLNRSVFGSGGDLGFDRDGSHAEYFVVPANAVISSAKESKF
jgi:NADPH2:quinone reductase